MNEESEPGSEKSSHASTAPGSRIEFNGGEYVLPPDWNDLEEVDYFDTRIERALAEREAESVRLYGKITPEELDHMNSRRVALREQFPQRSVVELNLLALSEVRAARR